MELAVQLLARLVFAKTSKDETTTPMKGIEGITAALQCNFLLMCFAGARMIASGKTQN